MDGDTFFSAWRDPEWTESSRERHEADEKNTYAHSFVTLDQNTRRAGIYYEIPKTAPS
jgi:hypothetical protein